VHLIFPEDLLQGSDVAVILTAVVGSGAVAGQDVAKQVQSHNLPPS
jgi:hypothetical protein